MTELTRQCLSLDRGKRERLARLLQESLARPEPTDDKRFRVLYEAATRMLGQGILSNSRDYTLVLGRRFIAYQMIEEGYSYSTIGRFLSKSHSSIMHMQKMMDDVFRYPEAFKLELAYWKQFQSILKENNNDESR